MEKIKVAVIGAGGKMGTRTSNNLVTKFPDKFDVKLVETFICRCSYLRSSGYFNQKTVC